MDVPELIVKRSRFGKKLRAVLYGLGPTAVVPCWGDKESEFYRRETTWGFLVREFEKCNIRYIEMLYEARVFVEREGAQEFPLDEDAQSCLDVDLDLLKRFQRHLYAYAKRVDWSKRIQSVPKSKVVAWWARKRTDHFLRAAICPMCGNDLPCQECGIPLYRLIPGWGLKAVP